MERYHLGLDFLVAVESNTLNWTLARESRSVKFDDKSCRIQLRSWFLFSREEIKFRPGLKIRNIHTPNDRKLQGLYG